MINVIILVILIFLDQITKFYLTSTVNTGAAFSLFQGQRYVLIAISIIVIFFILKYYKEKNYQFPLTLILAGTIGNLIDRIFLGHVRDFIDLKFWPVFNIADTCVVIGTLLLAYKMWKEKKST
ncbi:signal peptidase II [Candidatus Woesearchaeota archaeon]|nr:signal peptidase II [Candidatus Woesearchaeota archaeon]